MADLKITELDADATPSTDDLVVTVDAPGGSAVNKKVTIANLGKTIIADTAAVIALTADTAPTTDDLVVTVNSPGSGPAARKVTIANLLKVQEYEFLPIVWAINGAAPPEGLTTLTSTFSVDIRNFDDASDEDVYIYWQVPTDLTGTTITYRVICFVTNATGPSAEGVAFFLQGNSLGDGDILSGAMGTAVISSAAAVTHVQYDRFATAWSAAVTITALAAGETALLKLYRDVSDAADDYAQDIGVAGIEIKYTRQIGY